MVRSLLWPAGRPAGGWRLPDAVFADLELDRMAEWIAETRPDRRQAVRDVLAELPADTATVRWRAGITADLLASPGLCDRLADATLALRVLVQHRPEHFAADVPRAARIGARVVELQAYVEAVEILHRALESAELRSAGLSALAADVAAAAAGPEVRTLAAEIPHWRRTLDEVRRVTVAVNVSPALEPEGAAIVGFSAQPVAAADTALAQLMGQEAGERGIARLFRRRPVDWQASDGVLARELQALLETVAAPVERALHAHRLVGAQALAPLHDELVVLLGAVSLARRWRASGRPVCVAAAAEADGGDEWIAEDAWHPVLAAQLADASALVCNRVAFGGRGRVWVLTGPNRGGKTTYLRAVGVVQVLAQCGLPVPARAARITPCDRILTHFPLPEAGRPGEGRLDEEAERTADIFRQATPRSLVLLNEVLAGTSAPEGVALAVDILRGFRALGCRVVYATHLHELALRCGEINDSLPGPGTVAGLTVEAQAGPELEAAGGASVRRPTYRIVPGLPDGASHFASEIARQHGISLPQILELLRGRDVLP